MLLHKLIIPNHPSAKFNREILQNHDPAFSSQLAIVGQIAMQSM
jgi:hypothetical protein